MGVCVSTCVCVCVCVCVCARVRVCVCVCVSSWVDRGHGTGPEASFSEQGGLEGEGCGGPSLWSWLAHLSPAFRDRESPARTAADVPAKGPAGVREQTPRTQAALPGRSSGLGPTFHGGTLGPAHKASLRERAGAHAPRQAACPLGPAGRSLPRPFPLETRKMGPGLAPGC